jgi:hypothetical protein
MSKGSHQPKGRQQLAKGNESPHVQIWLFAPSTESIPQRSIREKVKKAAEERGWGFSVRRARMCRVVGGPAEGRPYDLVEPQDAAQVYSAAHRKNVLVLATGSCFVRKDPSVNPSRHRDLISLEGFVRYKTFFGMIRDRSDIAQHMQGFATWPPSDSCTGVHDPRVLPLHVFDNESEWPNLDQRASIDEFARRYGPGGLRTDAADRPWQQSAVFHGGDTLKVASYTLKNGFHWDVQRSRGAGRVVTAHEVWKLQNANSYCNIYQDG